MNSTPTPPKWADRFLEWYCRPDLIEDIQGDIHELYNRRVLEKSKVKANRKFIWDVFRYFRLSNINISSSGISTSSNMWGNYFKIGFRNLTKHRGQAIVNISSLSVGLACFILISLYVRYELSFDKYHDNHDRIYRLVSFDTEGQGIAKIPGPVGPALLEGLEELQGVTRFSFMAARLFNNGKDKFYETGGFYADSTVFNIFNYGLLEGEPASALSQLNSIVLTRSLAEKYFESESALGKTLDIDNETTFKVTGIIDDIPPNSHFTFNYLISMENDQRGWKENWRRTQYYTYFILAKGADPDVVKTKIRDVLQPYMEEDAYDAYIPEFQLLTSIHLNSSLFRELTPNGSKKRVMFYGIIGLLILLIGCVNFINILTAKAADRIKEVGIRKSLGAVRRELINQFLAEASVMVLLATFIALGFSYFLIPELNSITRSFLNFRDILSLDFMGILIAINVLTVLISGSYPAFYLSSFSAANLTNQNRTVSKSSLRNILVVFQLTISTFLIIAIAIVSLQQDFISGKDLGFTKDHVITIPLRDEEVIANYQTVKARFNKHPDVLGTTVSANLFGGGDYGLPILPEGFEKGEVPEVRMLIVDEDFLATYKMEILQGRNFKETRLGGDTEFMLNEAAVAAFGWVDPTGKTIAMPVIGIEPSPVVAIVKDFHFRSLHEPIQPIALFTRPSWFNVASVKIREGGTDGAISHIEKEWQDMAPEYPLTYYFFDRTFDNLYAAELRTSKIIKYASFLAVFVAIVGLISLTSFNIAKRNREFSVRKVMGATSIQIANMQLKRYVILTAISGFIGIPLALIFKDEWLNNFSYKVEISPLIFVMGAVITSLFVLLTVSYQCFKASNANPVDSLRTE